MFAMNKRGPTIRAAVIVLLSAVAGGCNSDRTCSLVGCMQGLTVSLDGVPPATRSAEVVISDVTGTEPVPLVTCTWADSDAGSPNLSCASGMAHAEFGSSIQLRDANNKKVRVTISDGTTTIADQTITPEYASAEIDGPGCGVCTGAMVVVHAR